MQIAAHRFRSYLRANPIQFLLDDSGRGVFGSKPRHGDSQSPLEGADRGLKSFLVGLNQSYFVQTGRHMWIVRPVQFLGVIEGALQEDQGVLEFSLDSPYRTKIAAKRGRLGRP